MRPPPAVPGVPPPAAPGAPPLPARPAPASVTLPSAVRPAPPSVRPPLPVASAPAPSSARPAPLPSASAPASVRSVPASSELDQTKRVLATKLAELSALNTEREQWVARLAERDARITELEAAHGVELPRLRTRVVDLESELSVVKHEVDRLGHLDAEAAALRGQARRIEAAAAEHAARVSVVEAALAEREARVIELERALELERSQAARVGALEALLDDERAKGAEREARLRTLESELEGLGWGSAPVDELTRIKGIGPKFRDALHDLGVTRFAQLAAWTEVDVATAAAKLRIQPARIVREGWVESAARLARA